MVSGQDDDDDDNNDDDDDAERARWVVSRGACSLEPSSSRLLKQLSMILLFSSSNLSALLRSRALMAGAATGKRSRQAEAAACGS